MAWTSENSREWMEAPTWPGKWKTKPDLYTSWAQNKINRINSKEGLEGRKPAGKEEKWADSMFSFSNVFHDYSPLFLNNNQCHYAGLCLFPDPIRKIPPWHHKVGILNCKTFPTMYFLKVTITLEEKSDPIPKALLPQGPIWDMVPNGLEAQIPTTH